MATVGEKGKWAKKKLFVFVISPLHALLAMSMPNNSLIIYLQRFICIRTKEYFIYVADFNSRCANKADYIEGVDDLPERDVVDFKDNA